MDATPVGVREGAGNDEELETACWVAISRVPHIGPARIERLLQRFGTLRAVWDAPDADLRAHLEHRPFSELMKARRRLDPRRELERVVKQGIRPVHPGHPAYPRILAEISGRPSILYTRGERLAQDDVAVGIVGTRRVTPYGAQVAEHVASELAQAGVTVVSGLARGVDAIAHRAALEAGGRTIAVLGSGPDVIYPHEHRRLASQILEAGAIVSELPPGSKPDAQNFPARNRIISGMSLGVVVIEAPMRSGALITASFAGDQGRDVFVIPGSVLSQQSEGTNQLLRDGARIVRNGLDVLEDLSLGAVAAAQTRQTELILGEEEGKLYAAIGSEPRHIDELAEASGLPAPTIAGLLVTMELSGLVRNHGAQFYVRR